MTFKMGENETEIDFVMIKEEHLRFVHNVRVIPGGFNVD